MNSQTSKPVFAGDLPKDKAWCKHCSSWVVPLACNDCYHNCKDWKCPTQGYCTYDMWCAEKAMRERNKN